MKLKPLYAAIGATVVLTGCVIGAQYDVIFDEIAPAVTEVEKNTIRATSGVEIAGEHQTIGYTTILKTGDTDNGETYGVVKDFQDIVIKELDGSDYLCNGTDTGQGSGLDHFSFLQKNGKIYMVSQFECGPGAMYMNELEQAADGTLSLKPNTLQYISQKEEFGGWVHCAGVTTPWQSHLGSEEYEPDANPNSPYPYTVNGYYNEVTEKYWGGDAAKNNPYYYGWTPEVIITGKGNPYYKKHYAMGRFAHELAYVMPDNKTVYLSDDGTNVGLFMFVADKPEKMYSGKLYAAKWSQTSADGVGMGEAKISWIPMGHANNAEIKALVSKQLAFSDIFDAEVPVGGVCQTAGFTSVNTAAGHECLKLKDVNQDGHINAKDTALAGRLETRRMAAMLGATVEFNKEEGITFNPHQNQLYVAMSQVRYGMEDYSKKGSASDSYDIGGPNDIKVAYNPCGAIYAMDVKADSKIGSNYVAYNMKGILEGTPKDYPAGSDYEGNTCDVDGIANPDNVTFLKNSDILTIGEDTSEHPNDMIWAYNVKSGDMKRIFTGPYGSETTSPFWHKDINGVGYLTVTTQHPFGEVSGSYVRPAGVSTKSESGYIGPFDFSKLK